MVHEMIDGTFRQTNLLAMRMEPYATSLDYGTKVHVARGSQ
ncbi:MAG TPA: hypothetical protein VK868_09860 [Pyrinomonadaceae bacterium]|nr:hypothetical protein [Pyrinomonadaceae bacterium]